MQFKNLLKSFLFAVFYFLLAPAWAQNKVITGKVTDSKDGSPLPGVSVLIKGSATGTNTNAAGSYSISVPAATTTLTFTFIGYDRQDIDITGKTTVNVGLTANSTTLNEVQVVCTVVSTDKQYDPDIVAMIGTSAALAVSGIPFTGPIGAARVAYTAAEGYILNPSFAQLATSELDMVVAGTKDAVLMVESEAKELPEDTMLGAVLYAHQEMQAVVQAVAELARDAGKPRWEWSAPAENIALKDALVKGFADSISMAYRITDKAKRYDRLGELRGEAVAELATETSGFSADDVKAAFGTLEYRLVRANIVAGQPRIDGRDNKTVRPIQVEVGVLGKAHGSALFTRGETQALVVATLGNARDAQIIDFL
ncbi:MAG: hypothetical protein EOP42_20765, partial [Sphingobacteriaceae bacterium]